MSAQVKLALGRAWVGIVRIGAGVLAVYGALHMLALAGLPTGWVSVAKGSSTHTIMCVLMVISGSWAFVRARKDSRLFEQELAATRRDTPSARSEAIWERARANEQSRTQ